MRGAGLGNLKGPSKVSKTEGHSTHKGRQQWINRQSLVPGGYTSETYDMRKGRVAYNRKKLCSKKPCALPAVLQEPPDAHLQRAAGKGPASCNFRLRPAVRHIRRGLRQGVLESGDALFLCSSRRETRSPIGFTPLLRLPCRLSLLQSTRRGFVSPAGFAPLRWRWPSWLLRLESDASARPYGPRTVVVTSARSSRQRRSRTLCILS